MSFSFFRPARPPVPSPNGLPVLGKGRPSPRTSLALAVVAASGLIPDGAAAMGTPPVAPPEPTPSPVCEAADQLDRETQYNCMKEIEQLWTGDFLPAARGTISMPDELSARPSDYSYRDLRTGSDLAFDRYARRTPVFENNSLEMTLRFAIEADPIASRQVAIAARDGSLPYRGPFITYQTIPAGTGTYYVDVDISEPPEPGERWMHYSVTIDGEQLYTNAAIVKHQPTGFGAFTLPVVPISLVYAPGQNEARSNTVQYTNSFTSRTTLTTRVGQETANSKSLGTEFAMELELKGIANLAGDVIGEGKGKKAKIISKGLKTFAKLLGSAKITETSIEATVREGALTVGSTDTRIDNPDNRDGLGQGDFIHYLRNARFAWVANDGRIRISLLGSESRGNLTVESLRADLEQLASVSGRCGSRDEGVGAQTGLTCSSVAALLDMDPFGRTNFPTLDPERFEPVKVESVAAGTPPQCRSYTRTLSRTDTTTRVRSTVKVEDYDRGLLAAIGLGVSENKDLKTTTTHTNSQATTNEETSTVDYCFGSDPDVPIDYQVTFDRAFGTYIISRAPEQMILGFCEPSENDEMMALRRLQGPALKAFASSQQGATLVSYEDDDVLRVNQEFEAGEWSGWTSLGGGPRREMVAAQHADGRVSVFGRGACGPMWTNTQTAPGATEFDGWRQEEAVVGMSYFAAGTDQGGHVVVYGIGSDGLLRFKRETARNSASYGLWRVLDTEIQFNKRPPTVAVHSDGSLGVFALTAEGELLYKRLISSGSSAGHFPSDWVSLGGGLSLAPVGAATSEDGRLHVFAQDKSGSLVFKRQTAAFATSFSSSWQSLGQRVPRFAPAAALDSRDRISVFTAAGGTLLHNQQSVSNGNSYSSRWTNISDGQTHFATPAIVRDAGGRLRLFERTFSGEVHEKTEGDGSNPFEGPWTPIPE